MTRVRTLMNTILSMKISQEANIVHNTQRVSSCCAPVGALLVLGTVYLGRRSAAAPLRLPQAGLFGPLRGDSRMRPCCSAAYGHKADTLMRNILKLPLFRRSPRLPPFHHPSLALPTRETSFLNTMIGCFHGHATPRGFLKAPFVPESRTVI